MFNLLFIHAWVIILFVYLFVIVYLRAYLFYNHKIL